MNPQHRAPTAELEKRPDGAFVRGRGIGKNELGTISVGESVVSKLAAQAAVEVADAGGAAPRMLGKSLAGAARLPGVRGTSLTTLPKASVRIDGAFALVQLELSVLWPVSIPAVTQQVRRHVQQRLNELTGLHVAEVAIKVTDVVTALPKPRVL